MPLRLIRTVFPLVVLLLSGCAPTDLYVSRLLNPGLPEPGDVCVTWLGTAGMLVSDGQTNLLIDPFVSRYGLLRVGLGFSLPPRPELIRDCLKRVGCSSAQAVLVSHSHFDHSLDAPYFARETDAVLVGSESTLNIGRGAGLPEARLLLVQPEQPMKFGAFTLRFIESRHGPALFGRVPYPGTIDEPLVPPQKASAYRLGGVYGILIEHPSGTILHHGSAGFLPGMYNDVRADVVLLGITGREDTETYLAAVPDKVRPHLLIPIHFDDFFTSLDDKIDFLQSSHFREFIETADRHGAYLVDALPLGRTVPLLPLSP